MAAQDMSKLSYTELRKLAEDALALAVSKRGEEIKVLADAYAKKTNAAGFSIEEAIDALKHYISKKSKASGAPAVVKYRDPARTTRTAEGTSVQCGFVNTSLLVAS